MFLIRSVSDGDELEMEYDNQKPLRQFLAISTTYSTIFFKRHERKSHCAVINRARKMNQIKLGRFLFAVLSWLMVNGMSSLMLRLRLRLRQAIFINSRILDFS